jgi:hypothetical protein
MTTPRLISCHARVLAVMREYSQAFTRMERHAGSLEALGVTRPKAVVLGGNKEPALIRPPAVLVLESESQGLGNFQGTP